MRQRLYTKSGYSPKDALTGGRWVPDRRGIQRWQPNPPRLRLAPDLDAVACRCGAKVTETCRTAQGHRTRDHVYRRFPRRCRCGGELRWKERVCDSCRVDKYRKKVPA